MPSSNASASPDPAKQADDGAPRLNPFAFISDTNLRFALLITFVIGADGQHWVYVGSKVRGLSNLVVEACLQGRVLTSAMVSDPAQREVVVGCIAPAMRTLSPFVLGGLTLLIAATLVFYALMPLWIGYRWHATRLHEDDVPGLSQELHALVLRAGLRRAPLFLWNPLGSAPAALAFGAFGQHRIAMTGALVAQSFIEPDTFRAVLLHELAHVRNRDVDKTMLAVAAWWGFIATTLPFYLAVEFVVSFSALDCAYSVFRFLALAALVLLTRNAVLRARELYADLRVSAWDRESDGLKKVLLRLDAGDGYRRFISPHPPQAVRLGLLRRTDRLFRFGNYDVFGVGAAASTLAIWTCMMAVLVIKPAPEDDGLRPFLMMLLMLLVPSIVMLLGLAAAAVATWRSVFQAVMRGSRHEGMLRVSFVFSAGLTAGVIVYCLPLLDPAASRFVALPAVTTLTLSFLAWLLVAWLLFGLVLTVLLSWVAASATAWLPFLLRFRQPGIGLAASLVLVCAFALLVPFLGAMVVYAAGKADGGTAGLIAMVWFLAAVGSVFPFNVVLWPGMAMVWAWPLAPALLARLRNRIHSGAWAWLDPVPGPVLPAARLYPGRAAMIGLAGGIVLGLALSGISRRVPVEWAHRVNHHEASSVVALTRMMLGAMLLQAPLAALAICAVPRLRTIHALLATTANRR